MHRLIWGRRLDRLADGEAKPRLALRVARHVARCPGCASELEAVRRLKADLRRLRPVVDPAVTRRLRERVVRASG